MTRNHPAKRRYRKRPLPDEPKPKRRRIERPNEQVPTDHVPNANIYIPSDCWGIVLEFVHSWTTVIAWDDAFCSDLSRHMARAEVEKRLKQMLAPSGPLDTICVGEKTKRSPCNDGCRHVSGRNSCKAVFFVPDFISGEVVPDDFANFERCKQTGAVKRPTETAVNVPRYSLFTHNVLFTERRKRPCNGNPEWLRSSALVRPRMRQGRIAEPYFEIMKRVVSVCQPMVREARKFLKVKPVWARDVLYIIKWWLGRLQIDINNL